MKKMAVVYKKVQADGIAKFERKRGYNARIKKCAEGYAVYTEKKKK
jgi:hypothetical protein